MNRKKSLGNLGLGLDNSLSPPWPPLLSLSQKQQHQQQHCGRRQDCIGVHPGNADQGGNATKRDVSIDHNQRKQQANAGRKRRQQKNNNSALWCFEDSPRSSSSRQTAFHLAEISDSPGARRKRGKPASRMRSTPNLTLQPRRAPTRTLSSSSLSEDHSIDTEPQPHYTSMQELLSMSGFSETRVITPVTANFKRRPQSPVLQALRESANSSSHASFNKGSVPLSPTLSHKASFTERLLGSIWKPTANTINPSEKSQVTGSIQGRSRSSTLSTRSVASTSLSLGEAEEDAEHVSVDNQVPECSFDQEEADLTADFARTRAMEWVMSAGMPSQNASDQNTFDTAASPPCSNRTQHAADYFTLRNTSQHHPSTVNTCSLSPPALDVTVPQNETHRAMHSPTESAASQSLYRTLRMAKSVPAIKNARDVFPRSDSQSPSVFSMDSSTASSSLKTTNTSIESSTTTNGRKLRRTASQAVLRPAVPLSPLLTVNHNITTPGRPVFGDRTNSSNQKEKAVNATRVVKMPSPERDPQTVPQGQRKSVFDAMPIDSHTPVKSKRKHESHVVRDLAVSETGEFRTTDSGGSLARLFGRKQQQRKTSATDTLRGIQATAKVLPFPVGIVPPAGMRRQHKSRDTPLVVLNGPPPR